MQTVQDLKVGDRFIKWDGSTCVLIEKTEGRARIRVEDRPRQVKSFTVTGADGQPRQVEFDAPKGKAEYDVALGCEILEVLSK